MRFQTKLLIVSALLLALSLSAAGLAFFGAERSRHHLERSRLAHDQLEAYLRLSGHTYELFKEWGDALMLGDMAGNLERRNLQRRLEEDLERVRRSISSERLFLAGSAGNGGTKELERLDRLRKLTNGIIVDFQAVELLGRQGFLAQARAKLVALLERSIDTEFRDLIREAVRAERKAVAAVEAGADRLNRRLASATQLHAGAAVLLTFGCMVYLLRQFRRPLSELLAGTKALSAGDLSYRIGIVGRDEFALLGESFDRMAGELQAHRTELEQAREGLEEAVAERTEELRLANRALAEGDANRRRFFADISHELRTPLTIIRGEAQVALRGKAKRIEAYKVSLERVQEQARHLGNLVDDLLFMAREGAGDTRLASAPVDLRDLTTRVCDDARVLANEKGIAIELETRADPPIRVAGDAGRLRQLLLILLDNAVSYSDEGGRITVDLVRKGPQVAIRVADRGIGIAQSEIGSVFERFNRGANAIDRHAEGLGLGLPVAKAIVDAHKGRIDVESEPNEGTTFSVSLPLLEEPDA